MSIKAASSSSLDLPSQSARDLVERFTPALRTSDSRAKAAMNAYKDDPTNQAKALEAQQAQSALDNLWRTLTTMIESMGKTIEAIIAAMRA